MGGMAERWDVTSGDGGSIAVWVDVAGPPLVPVHGSVSDHNAFAALGGRAARPIHSLRHGPPRLRCQSGWFRLLRGTRVQRRCGGRGGSCGADWAAGGAVRLLLGRELGPRRCPRSADAASPHPLRAELGPPARARFPRSNRGADRGGATARALVETWGPKPGPRKI